MAFLRHKNCQDPDCEDCLECHERLANELEARSGIKADHLSKYRTWLDKQYGNSETEAGWAKPFVFEESIIQIYLRDVWGVT